MRARMPLLPLLLGSLAACAQAATNACGSSGCTSYTNTDPAARGAPGPLHNLTYCNGGCAYFQREDGTVGGFPGDKLCDCRCASEEDTNDCPQAVKDAEAADCKIDTVDTVHASTFQIRHHYLGQEKCASLEHANLVANTKTRDSERAFEPAFDYRVFVSISRKKNALWTGFANGLAADDRFDVRWTNSLKLEAEYMKQVVKWADSHPKIKVVVVTKFCGSNGACAQQGVVNSTLKEEYKALGDKANVGDAYTEAYKRKIPVIFAEYGIPTSGQDKRMNNITFAAIQTSPVVCPDSVEGGFMLGQMLINAQKHMLSSGLKILILKGSHGHVPCADKVKGFRKSLAAESAKADGMEHTVAYTIHAGYTRELARTVMREVFVRDQTIDVVFACNDDMAIGALQAAEDVENKRPLLVLGYNNDTQAQVRLQGQKALPSGFLEETAEWAQEIVGSISHVPPGHYDKYPSQFASVEQMHGFTTSVALLVKSTVAESLSTFNSDLLAEQNIDWNAEVLQQRNATNVKISSPIGPVYSERCHLLSYSGGRCPGYLTAAIERMPMYTEIIFGPLYSVALFLFTTFLVIYIPCVLHIGEVGVRKLAHKMRRLRVHYLDERGQVADVQVDRSATKNQFWHTEYWADTFRDIHEPIQSQMYRYTFWSFSGLKPASFLASWVAGVVWRLRLIPEISYNQDETTITYGQLEVGTATRICSCGMSEAQGINYLTSLLAFLIVFRFANMYGRVVATRNEVGNLEVSLRDFAMGVQGMVAKDRWNEKRTLGIRHRVAALLKTAFTVYGIFFHHKRNIGHKDVALILQTLSDENMKTNAQLRKFSKELLANSTRLMQEEVIDDVNMCKQVLRVLYYKVCTCLLFEVQKMVAKDQQYARGGKHNKGGIDCSAALINVAQMAKLTGCVSNMMAALNKTMNAIDIFRSKDETIFAYPLGITFVTQLLLLCYTLLVGMVIGCKTHPAASFDVTAFGYPFQIGVAETVTLLVTLAFTGLYDAATDFETPFGDDMSDFHLNIFEKSMVLDIYSMLEVSDGTVVKEYAGSAYRKRRVSKGIKLLQDIMDGDSSSGSSDSDDELETHHRFLEADDEEEVAAAVGVGALKYSTGKIPATSKARAESPPHATSRKGGGRPASPPSRQETSMLRHRPREYNCATDVNDVNDGGDDDGGGE